MECTVNFAGQNDALSFRRGSLEMQFVETPSQNVLAVSCQILRSRWMHCYGTKGYTPYGNGTKRKSPKELGAAFFWSCFILLVAIYNNKVIEVPLFDPDPNDQACLTGRCFAQVNWFQCRSAKKRNAAWEVIENSPKPLALGPGAAFFEGCHIYEFMKVFVPNISTVWIHCWLFKKGSKPQLCSSAW